MKMLLVAGARPNFMKIAPIVRALRAEGKKVKTWEDGKIKKRRPSRLKTLEERPRERRSDVVNELHGVNPVQLGRKLGGQNTYNLNWKFTTIGFIK